MRTLLVRRLRRLGAASTARSRGLHGRRSNRAPASRCPRPASARGERLAGPLCGRSPRRPWWRAVALDLSYEAGYARRYVGVLAQMAVAACALDLGERVLGCRGDRARAGGGSRKRPDRRCGRPPGGRCARTLVSSPALGTSRQHVAAKARSANTEYCIEAMQRCRSAWKATLSERGRASAEVRTCLNGRVVIFGRLGIDPAAGSSTPVQPPCSSSPTPKRVIRL
jgi:hypothetical protein